MKEMFKTMLSNITGVSLFIKVMGIALFLIILFGISTIIENRILITRTFQQEIKDKGISISRHLAKQLTEPIIIGDLLSIYELIKETLEIYPDIRYIIILNQNNKLIAHSLTHSLTEEFITANKLSRDSVYNIEFLETEDGLITDVVVPILDGKIGIVRIGLMENKINEIKGKITQVLAIFVLLVSIIGIINSYILAFILNKPLINLIKGIEEVRHGNLGTRVHKWFNDEIGRLTESFNEMAASLEQERIMRHNLMKKLITTQEDERQRISRELHDMTSQSLTSLKIGLKSLESGYSSSETKIKVEEFRLLLNKSLEEIHGLSVELRPPLLSDFGLFKTIEEFLKRFAKNFDIDVKYEVDDSLKNQRFAQMTEISLYRIIQEAFSNIEKHSKSSEVKVNLKKVNSSFCLTIEDNGIGFDVNKPLETFQRKPIGLFGMRERVEILGGKFKIDSKPGEGVKIYIEIPISFMHPTNSG